MTHRMVPLAPGRTWVECTWLFPATAEGEPAIDPAYAVDFWDITNREDWGACESVQRGLESPHFRPGPLAPNEDAVHQWVTMIGRAYQGVAPHLPPPERRLSALGQAPPARRSWRWASSQVESPSVGRSTDCSVTCSRAGTRTSCSSSSRVTA